MNQVYKQMIVMLLSVAFMASVAVIVLSSSAAAYNLENELYQMEGELDALREQQRVAEASNDRFRSITAFIIVFTGFIIAVNHSNKNATPDYRDWDATHDEPIAETDDKYWCVYDHPAPDQDIPDDDDDIDDGWIYDNERNIWIDPCDQDDPIPEYDRREAQTEIERERSR